MLLFISHASEDQDDFVRPLAEALAKKHTVWYSEYELTLGDSLLEKIDQGLANCDFGVVVLSKSFFAKKWPRAEIDGLFARETRSHKIILPIWKDVTEDEVKAFSPILSSKLAVSTAQGIASVIEKIEIALSVSSRQRKHTVVDAARQHVQKLRQTVADKRLAEQILHSERGVELITASFNHLIEIIGDVLKAGEDSSSPIKFQLTRHKSAPNQVSIRTVHGMYLQIRLANLYVNSADATVLESKVFQQRWDLFGQAEGPLREFETHNLRPTIQPADEVIWLQGDKVFNTEELAVLLIEKFSLHIRDQVEEQRKS